MHVRRAQIDDLDELAVLFDEYRIFYSQTSNVARARAFLENRLNKNESVIFVSVSDDNKLSGFTQLYPLFSSVRLSKLWQLNDLYVNQAYRGLGAGIALIEESKQLCRETKSCGMILETSKSNHVGNTLYSKCGFELDAEDNYYCWSSGELGYDMS